MTTTTEDTFDRMLEEAMSHPGVAAAADVYGRIKDHVPTNIPQTVVTTFYGTGANG